MDMVDSYVRAVAQVLPAEQRDDISRELSEDIRSEMEDRRKELGRELTAAEQEALLKRRGNPLLLASRYRQDTRSLVIGRELIGPELFPFYVKVLSFNLGLTFVIIGSIFLALTAGGQKIGLGDMFSSCLLQLLIQLAIVTFFFALGQKHLTKYPDRWHLKGKRGGLALDLSASIEADVHARFARGKGRTEVSRFDSGSLIVASLVAIVWLTEVQSHPFLVLGPGALFMKLGPAWHQAYLPIVLLTAAQIVQSGANLVRPDWVRFWVIARVLINAGGLAVVYSLLKAGSWVMLADGAADRASQYTQAIQIVNQCFYWGLLVGTVWAAGVLVFRIVDLLKRWR